MIAASAVIHDGWEHPVRVQNTYTGEEIYLIKRDVNSNVCGGHAFAIVGYNEVDFLVQNSWGSQWGKDGFATLPYEDWLDLAYDAWVARLGVPKTPFASGRQLAKDGTGGKLVTAPGPDLKRLAMHVVNLGNDGQLSTTGKFISTVQQIDTLFERMDTWHSAWITNGLTQQRHIVLYAHGGLTSETSGLDLAQRQVNWWLNNGVYPVFFAWQSGLQETLFDQIVDNVKQKLPFGAGFDLAEQVDRWVERFARSNLRWTWDQMKQNARAASKPISNAIPAPGASLTVKRLAQYSADHPNEQVVVHLVGHSAGAIFHAELLQCLREAKIPVDSLSLLAPALRVDEFQRDILPHLGDTVKRFATFAMSDNRELDDVCAIAGFNAYNKSLLYLVARALEIPAQGSTTFEVPLLGMQHFLDAQSPGGGRTLNETITAAGGAVIFAPTSTPDDSRCDVYTHGAFDDDTDTMTSVLLRVLDQSGAMPKHTYKPNAPLLHDYGVTSPDSQLVAEPVPSLLAAAAPVVGSDQPLTAAADTNPPGTAPLSETAPPQLTQPQAPPWAKGGLPELAVAPRSGSPVFDMLQSQGWIYRSMTAEDSTETAEALKPSDKVAVARKVKKPNR